MQDLRQSVPLVVSLKLVIMSALYHLAMLCWQYTFEFQRYLDNKVTETWYIMVQLWILQRDKDFLVAATFLLKFLTHFHNSLQDICFVEYWRDQLLTQVHVLRTILAVRGAQSPYRQDWLDLNPTVCSDSIGPSGVKSDILSYWVWVILVQTFWRYLGNSRLWPVIWLFVPKVCYRQTSWHIPGERWCLQF